MATTREFKAPISEPSSVIGKLALNVKDKTSKNSFKNEFGESVYVLYTAKTIDTDEIVHHLGGKSQKGNCAEVNPHIYHVLIDKTVKIESKKMGKGKQFLTVVGEVSCKILLFNHEKKSGSGLFRFSSKKVLKDPSIMVTTKKLEIQPKEIKRFIIYGKETKEEYKNRLILQMEQNQFIDTHKRKEEEVKKLEEKKELKEAKKEQIKNENRAFVHDVILKATPTTTCSFGVDLNLGISLGSGSAIKDANAHKQLKSGNDQKYQYGTVSAKKDSAPTTTKIVGGKYDKEGKLKC